MKKVLLTATVQQHITSFHLPLIRLLQDKGFEVHVAARDVMGEKIRKKLDAADAVFDIPFERSPFAKGNIGAYKELKRLIDENNYDIIHCNTPVASILTRIAARQCRKKGTIVIYTAHGFHFYKGAPLMNWLIYYPIEWLFGRRLTDCLINICDEDYAFAKKKKLCKKVERIHGAGVDSERFTAVSAEEKQALRCELGVESDARVCLCTGELNQNKNQSLLIAAVPAVLRECPKFLLLLAGEGDKRDELEKQISVLGVQNNVRLLGFRSDIDKLIAAADFAASASIREGLGINIIEAMLSERPAVATRNRGHNELVLDGESGFLVNFDSEEVSKAFLKLALEPEFCERLGKNAYIRAERYSIKNVITELDDIYTSLL